MGVNVLGDGALEFDAIIDGTQFQAQIRKMEADIARMSNKTIVEGKKMDSVFRNLALTAGTFFTLRSGASFINDIIQVRGEFQGLDIALTTILQNKEKADALFAQVIDFAARTPFQLTEVGQATKQLLAYGVASEEVLDVTRRLGDVSAGLSLPLNDLIYLYGTTRIQGRLYTRDLIQFTGRGINLTKSLAEQFGVAETAVRGLVESGQVGFEHVKVAIEGMTSEGGSFFDLMAKKSLTVTGQISNLRDEFDQMLNEIGESNEGTIYSGIGALKTLVENYDKILKTIGVLITTYGTYRAALIASSVATDLLATRKTAYLRLLVQLRRAQAFFNATLSANPYVFLATAIAGLVSTLVLFRDRTTSATRAQNEFNEAIKKGEKIFESEKQRFDELVAIAKDETQILSDRKKAVEELQKEYPQYLKNLKLEGINSENTTEAITKQTAAIRLLTTEQGLQAKQEELLDRLARLRKTNANENPFSTAYTQKASGGGDPQLDEKTRRDLILEIYDGLNLINERYKELDKSREESNEADIEANSRTVEFIKEQISALEKKRDAESQTSGQYIEFQKQIIELEKELKSITGEKDKVTKDTIKDYNQVRQALADIRDQIRIDQLSSNEQEIEEAKKKYDKLRELAVGNSVLLAQIESVQQLELQSVKDKQFRAKLEQESKDGEARAKKIEEEYQQLFEKTKTYEQRYNDLLSQYDQERRAIRERGDVANLEVLDAQFKNQKDQLAAEIADTQNSVNALFGNIEGLSKTAVKNIIADVQRLIDEMLKPLFGEDSEVIKGLLNQIQLIEKELDKKVSANFAEIGHVLGEMSFSIRELDRVLGDVVAGTADVLINIAKTRDSFIAMNDAGESGDGFGQLLGGLSGIDGVLSIATSIAKVIEGIFSKARERRKAAEEFALKQYLAEIELNQLYRDRLRTVEDINKLTLQGVSSQIDLLKRQSKEVEAEYNQLIKKLGDGLNNIWFGLKLDQAGFPIQDINDLSSLLDSFDELEVLFERGLLGENASKMFEQLRGLKEELDLIGGSIDEINDRELEILTGTTSDSITDSIIDGFRNGLRGAENFADNFEDLMRNALISSLRDELINSKAIEEFYKSFAAASESGGQLTENEIANLRNEYQNIVNGLDDRFKAIQDIAGIDFGGDQKGLAGSIRRDLTEETAGELAGLWRGQYDITKRMLNVSVEQLNVANRIERNTGLTVEEIRGMREEIRSIESNTRQGAGGRDIGLG